MTIRNHRIWLSFVQQAASLPLDYSHDDLTWIKEVAHTEYPSLEPLISACIKLIEMKPQVEDGASSANRSLRAARSKVRAPRITTGPSKEFLSFFTDTRLFPKVHDLIAFAKANLTGLPNFRFDKMSRARIIEIISTRIDAFSAEEVNILLKRLTSKKINEGAAHESPGFVSTWETVIKNS